MKKIVPCFLLGLVVLAPSVSGATNYNDNGSTATYNLYSGDTLKIISGNYRGRINTFAQNAVIFITSNGSFTPNSIGYPQGTIVNYGVCTINSSLSTGQYFQIKNYQYCTINGASLNGTQQNWYNSVGCVLTVNGNFRMNASATAFVNDGEVNVNGSVTLNTGSLFTNKFKVKVTNTFTVNGGALNNEGEINVNNTVAFNSGITTNTCKLILERNFTNNGTLINSGLIWAPKMPYTTTITNNGTIVNTTGSYIKGTNFTNYGTVNGNARLYFTATTYTSSTVGTPGPTTDSVKVYDVTRSNLSTIFDTQWGTVYANTVYRVLPAPDTLNAYSGCSDIYKTSIPLPAKWNYFYTKMVQQQPVILWSAEYEANMKFEIERSYDQINFEPISSIYSNSNASYTFTDVSISKSKAAAYYRIKAVSINGAPNYTDVKSVQLNKRQTTTSIYPNPVKDRLTIEYTASSTEQIILVVKNSGGQTMTMKNIVAKAGVNQVELNEIKTLNTGMYFVDLISGNSIIASEKFVKQ